MKIITQLVVVAVLAGAGGGAWVYKDRLPFSLAPAAEKRSGPRARVIPVEVAAARTGEVIIAVETVGTARANEAVFITTKVTGLITKISFKEGQRVRSGALLVHLDASELKAELEEKRAERDIARRFLDRAQRLLKTRNVPEARVEELTAALEAAEARVRADEARIAEYVIRAPFSGRLGMRRVSVGALVEPGDEITTLDDVKPIKLDFDVPETAIGNVKPGLPVTAKSAAMPERTFKGKVVLVGSRVDQVTRSIAVRAIIPNDDEVLKPGMFLNVILILEKRPNAVLIPEEAVVSSGSKHFVFALEGGKAVNTEVELGQRVAGEVEVLSGLEAGMLVIVGGLQKVRDGVAVKPLEPKGTS